MNITTSLASPTRPKHTQPHQPQQKHDIAALKDRMLIPQVWQALGLQGQPQASCRSPFRPDKSPSFSIYEDGRRWKDFATNEGGDVIDFIATARQLSPAQALRLFLELCGVPVMSTPTPAYTPAHALPTHPQPQAAYMRGMPVRVPRQTGKAEDRAQVADTRHISVEAVSLALSLHTLTFGRVQGWRCWILTDAEQRCAEARRMEGHPFPESGPLAARKAHTLRGSCKSWPLGAAVLRRIPNFRILLLVEGGPDYLAALHFASELERWDVLPVAMLGRGTGTHIDPAALELMQGRRVRIYPHADADGGGMQNARLWAAQLHTQGCDVDFCEFADFHRTDGIPVKDLNDCTTALDDASLLHLRQTLIPAPIPPPPDPNTNPSSI